MIQFFTYSTNDQSIYYLDQMFGYMDNVLPVGEGTTTIISAMLKTINTAALVMGAFLITYNIIMGLLKTAEEGEFLGKQWSSLWVPLRTVVGVASLFPTSAGYSLLQIVLMWMIVQGVGAADTLWNTVLAYITTYKSPYAVVNAGSTNASSSGTSITIPSVMTQLYQALTCMETLGQTGADTYSDPNGTHTLYYCSVLDKNYNSDPFCQQNNADRINVTGAPPNTTTGYYTYQIGPSGTCGTLMFPDPQSYVDPKNKQWGVVCKDTVDSAAIIECAGLTQQVSTLGAIVGTMDTFAQLTVNYDHQYLMFYNGNTAAKPPTPYGTPEWISNYCSANSILPAQCCMPANGGTTACTASSQFPQPYVTSNSLITYSDSSPAAANELYWTYGLSPTLTTSANEPAILASKYIGDINTAVANATVAQGTNIQGEFSDANNNGWLVAGTYYYMIASMSNSIQTSQMPPLSIRTADPALSDSSVGGYRVNFATAQSILNSITSSTTASISSTPPQMANMGTSMNSAAAAITNNFRNELTGGGISTNPLVAAQAFGEDLLISAQATYGPLLVISTGVIILSNINILWFGEGLTDNPFGPGTEFMALILWAIYMFFAGWCFTFGGMLAIYMPLVPYIIFTFGVIGWFIAVLEAMVAAPFVALGILSPTGHEIWGRAEPAVLILLNTCLRPTLMIFAMIVGMLLAPIVVTIINNGFDFAIGSVYGGAAHAPGPVELILIITAYGSLVVTSMNKCFAVIYMIPDRVLTWLGGQPQSYGEAESMQQVKGMVESASGAIKEGASSLGKTSHDAGESLGKTQSQTNEAANKKARDANKPKMTAGKAGESPGAEGGEGGDAGETAPGKGTGEAVYKRKKFKGIGRYNKPKGMKWFAPPEKKK